MMKWFFSCLLLPFFLCGLDCPEWMLAQIRKDYAEVQPSDLHREKIENFLQNWNGTRGFIRYQIRNNRLHSETLLSPNHERVRLMNRAMNKLLQLYSLPDADFVVCLEDSIDGANLSIPCFAFARNQTLSEKILLIPDFEALERGGSFRVQAEKGISKYPWGKRKEKAFWRGGATGGTFNENNFTSFPRSRLVNQSLLHPDLINAKLILPLVQSDNPQRVSEIYAIYFGKQRSIEDHLQYKYQILVDGNTCAYSRAFWQLFSGCPIFKHDSPNIQWYYGALIPYVHYIPCEWDFSDLAQKVLWAQKHDKEVKKIGKRARAFAIKNLRDDSIYKYLYLTILEYAKRQSQLN